MQAKTRRFEQVLGCQQQTSLSTFWHTERKFVHILD